MDSRSLGPRDERAAARTAAALVISGAGALVLTQVIAEAAKAINSLDPLKVAEELHKGNTYKTVIGDLAFDAKGDVTRIDYVMYTWQKQPDGSIGYVQN